MKNIGWEPDKVAVTFLKEWCYGYNKVLLLLPFINKKLFPSYIFMILSPEIITRGNSFIRGLMDFFLFSYPGYPTPSFKLQIGFVMGN